MDYNKLNIKKDVVYKWKFVDDFYFKLYDNEVIFGGNDINYDILIKMDFVFCIDVNGYFCVCFNNLIYID